MEYLTQSENVIDLHNRTNDRLNVTLWWVRGTMDTFVTVEDGKAEDNFSVPVPPGENPMHYFNHPMVYSPIDYGQRQVYTGEGEQ